MNNNIKSNKMLFGLWSVLGITTGLSFGMAINSFTVGIAMGLCLSFLLGTISERVARRFFRIRLR